MSVERITEFEELLLGPLIGSTRDRIVKSVLFHEEDFPKLYALINSQNEKISWRATWACEKLSEQCPEWFMDKRKEIIGEVLEVKHDGKKRLLLSILYNLPLEDMLDVDLLNACMDWMFSPKESIAVQALSIHLAYRFCLCEPELLPELKVYLENAEMEFLSVGVQSAVRNTLKKINKKKR